MGNRQLAEEVRDARGSLLVWIAELVDELLPRLIPLIVKNGGVWVEGVVDQNAAFGGFNASSSQACKQVDSTAPPCSRTRSSR